MPDVTIASLEPVRVAAIRHVGPYTETGQAFMRLFMWAGPRGLAGPDAKAIGLYWDDPATVPEPELRSDACVAVADDVEADPAAGVEIRTVDGGDYAVVRHQGPYTEVPAVYKHIFETWLPTSGRSLREAPCFERYLNNPLDTAPADLLTDVHVPLA